MDTSLNKYMLNFIHFILGLQFLSYLTLSEISFYRRYRVELIVIFIPPIFVLWVRPGTLRTNIIVDDPSDSVHLLGPGPQV